MLQVECQRPTTECTLDEMRLAIARLGTVRRVLKFDKPIISLTTTGARSGIWLQRCAFFLRECATGHDLRYADVFHCICIVLFLERANYSRCTLLIMSRCWLRRWLRKRPNPATLSISIDDRITMCAAYVACHVCLHVLMTIMLHFVIIVSRFHLSTPWPPPTMLHAAKPMILCFMFCACFTFAIKPSDCTCLIDCLIASTRFDTLILRWKVGYKAKILTSFGAIQWVYANVSAV